MKTIDELFEIRLKFFTGIIMSPEGTNLNSETLVNSVSFMHYFILSILFKQNLAQSIYTQRCSCVGNDIILVLLGAKKQPKLVQKVPKNGNYLGFVLFSKKTLHAIQTKFLQSFCTILGFYVFNDIKIV